MCTKYSHTVNNSLEAGCMILSPQNGVKSQRFSAHALFRTLLLYWVCFFPFFYYLISFYNIHKVFSHYHLRVVFSLLFFFIALHHGRPALTHTRNAGEGCGSRLLLPDILRCTCHLTFHSNDGQGRVTAFSLSQRAFLNIFSSSRCIR